MADGTKIEWTDATVNAVNGCTRVSPGCGGPGPHGGCYAELLAGTRLRNHPSRAGLTEQTPAGPRWTGKILVNYAAMIEPLRWRRPRKIFWNAHGDLFHKSVSDDVVDDCLTVAALTPHHIHQFLTKRPDRQRAYFDRAAAEKHVGRVARLCASMARLEANGAPALGGAPILAWPLPNVWLGTSVEDQQRANERVPDLIQTPAAVRFLSCEPLLGPLDLGQLQQGLPANAWLTWLDDLHWVIVGGESGPKARPMHPDWARSLRDQCAAAGVPFFFKQWGEWAPHPDGKTEGFGREGAVFEHGSVTRFPRGQRHGDVWLVGKKAAGRLLDGVQHDGVPAHD